MPRLRLYRPAGIHVCLSGFVFAHSPSKLFASALERSGVALGFYSGGLGHRCRQFLVHRFKQAIGCSPSGGREAADDPADVPLLHRDRFRCRVAPDHRSRSSIQQLRRDRAHDAYIPALVHFLQSLYVAAQHIRRLRTTLVGRHALEERLGPKTFLHILRDSLAWIHRPTMVFVEPDLLWTGTIYDAAFAEVFRTSEFTDRHRVQSTIGRCRLRKRRREVKDIGCGVTNAPTPCEHECSDKSDCQVLHCGILRSTGCLVRMRLQGRCLRVSVMARTFSDAERRFRTVSPKSASLEPTTF